MTEERTDSERPAGKASAGSAPKRLRGWTLACLLFAFAGLVAAGMAWRTHWQVRTSPPEFKPACTLSATVDCARAARSEWAVLFRVPVALWAALGFAGIACFAAAGLRRGEGDTFPGGVLFLGGTAALAAAVAMAALARFSLGVLCIECTVIQVMSLAVFVTAAMNLRERRIGPARAIASDLRTFGARRVGTALAVCLLAPGVALLIALYPQHGWLAPQRGTDPRPAPVLSGPGGVPTGRTDRGNPFIGAGRPAVAVMEFTDYECPHCHEAHRVLREIVARHPDRIRLVHFHLPLDQKCNPDVLEPFHRQACDLAEAAACAAFQGRFWELNDAMIGAAEGDRRTEARTLAGEAGLDMAAFDACLRDGSGRARVDADLRASAIFKGGGLEIGTPAFVIQDSSGHRRTYVGLGGKQGIPESVLRRLEAGWPVEQDPNSPAGRSEDR